MQRAKAEKIEVPDDDLTATADRQVARVRAQFTTETEYRETLRKEGIGTPEEFRKLQIDQIRRAEQQKRLIEKLKQEGKLVQVNVTEAEVAAEFEKQKSGLPKKPALIALRQIIVPHRYSEKVRAVARAKAESLLAEIRAGGNFEQVAKRESMDPGSRETGGDLGWNRRGKMVPEFDRVMFALPVGQVSPVIESRFGYHIMRVDRVQPAEVKARHILIKPTVDSADIAATRALADSVAARWRAGGSYDSLADRHHDSDEERNVPAFERDKLPEAYATALRDTKVKTIADPFPISDPVRGAPKFVVAQVESLTEEGEFSLADFRNQIRQQLQQRRSEERLLASLRREIYIAIRL